MSRIRKHRLMVDFKSQDAMLDFADLMNDRLLEVNGHDDDVIVREADVLDDRGGGIRRYIVAREDAMSPGETVWRAKEDRRGQRIAELRAELERLGA